MEYTGERMVPEGAQLTTYLEHIFRYAFACKRVRNAEVLDIASGEGYGTYALSKVAKNVIGVDVSPEAVDHAKRKYDRDFRVGSAEQIPVPSDSRDVVVSFETIEHVPDPKQLVQEAFRVLRPGGLFIVSTPNKDTYRPGAGPNPFHCSELTEDEFVNVLNPCFEITEMFGQIFPSCAMDDFQKFVGIVSDRLAYFLRRKIEDKLKTRYLPVNATSSAGQRQSVVEAIPSLSPPLEQLWNPYALRRLKAADNPRPMYFIAMATKRSTKK